MPDDSHAADNVESTYPALEAPGEFKSQIPEHLLNGTSETDRYIMEQISIMRQYSDWSVKAHLSADRNLRYTNGKVRRHDSEIKTLQADKRAVMSGWKLLLAIGAGIAGVLAFIATLVQLFGASSQ